MGFNNNVRKYRIIDTIEENGAVRTAIASGNESSWRVKIVARVMNLLKRNNKVVGEEGIIQPIPVQGVPVFDNNVVVEQQSSIEQQPKSILNPTDGHNISPSVKKKVSFDPTLSTVPEEDGDNLSISTDDGISLDSSEDFDDAKWAAIGLPLSPIKKVGIVQRVKNILGSFIDFFVSPFKSKQTAPASTTIDAHLGLVVLDDSTTPSYVGFDHDNTAQQKTTSGISTYVEEIDTEPQQHTATIESVAAIVPTLV
ncbi:Hypothetical protein CINCED_3A009756 [Cinara cedri]|uniref:Uncharacterized protein n=1 Tax=Cinara cedri TaxID=506608 RepID=A0A5E4MS52_9HEMI|nr:Hypothetical protein CINCED_3A009756 [Cinara cedri]